jgi:hypothetical protein
MAALASFVLFIGETGMTAESRFAVRVETKSSTVVQTVGKWLVFAGIQCLVPCEVRLAVVTIKLIADVVGVLANGITVESIAAVGADVIADRALPSLCE